MIHPRYHRAGMWLALGVFILDQLVKGLILYGYLEQLSPGITFFHDTNEWPPQRHQILPFFELVMVWNRGVSFGLFANESAFMPYILIAIALAISALVYHWLRQAENQLMCVACGLIIGGALGNVVDRIRFGAVADFFYFNYGGYYWPAFNIADSAIVLGAILIIIEGWYSHRRQKS